MICLRCSGRDSLATCRPFAGTAASAPHRRTQSGYSCQSCSPDKFDDRAARPGLVSDLSPGLGSPAGGAWGGVESERAWKLSMCRVYLAFPQTGVPLTSHARAGTAASAPHSQNPIAAPVSVLLPDKFDDLAARP